MGLLKTVLEVSETTECKVKSTIYLQMQRPMKVNEAIERYKRLGTQDNIRTELASR